MRPHVLLRNEPNWTAAVVGRIQSGETPTRTERNRYNHAEIKAALLAETHRKCAYCESKLRHVTYGDIEHVVPKTDEPARWFDWANLTIACDVCNTNKASAPGDGDAFIDPYAVDPEEHFWQMGPIMYARPGCDAAALTERLLKLNRADLVERRKKRQDQSNEDVGCDRAVQRPAAKGTFCGKNSARSRVPTTNTRLSLARSSRSP